MIKRGKHSIAAFTIFEVTVVLAIMSVLITIISYSLNRFNEQLKFTSDINQELNEWRAVRASIWKEFYTTDSIQCVNGELHLFSGDRIVDYKIVEESLHRRHGTDWTDLKMDAEAIYEEKKEASSIFHIDFLWKQEVMALSYYYKPAVDLQINDYFDRLE